MKWGRTFSLTVQGRNGTPVTLSYPLTLKFDITHNTFSDANSLDIQIYNISTAHQKQIYWDMYIKQNLIPIQLYAGYQSSPPVPQIFTGYVKEAYTERLGSDVITHITAYDGGYGIANGTITYTSPKSPLPTASQLFTTMVTQGLPYVTPGNYVVATPPVFTSPTVFSGAATWEALDILVPKGGFKFIADGVANILGPDDNLPVTNSLGTLQSSTGLLGVPKRRGSQVSCSCIFEPRMKLGQTLTLNSSFAPWVNGYYQIIGYHHFGTISAVESGEATTEISLMYVNAALALQPEDEF